MLRACLMPTAQIRTGDSVTWILGWLAQPRQVTTMTSGPTYYTHIMSGFINQIKFYL